MAQLIVRNLDETTKTRLKQRAELHGCSMEEEVRQILQNIVQEADVPSIGLGSRMVARFSGMGLSEDLPEWHGQCIAPLDFDT